MSASIRKESVANAAPQHDIRDNGNSSASKPHRRHSSERLVAAPVCGGPASAPELSYHETSQGASPTQLTQRPSLRPMSLEKRHCEGNEPAVGAFLCSDSSPTVLAADLFTPERLSKKGSPKMLLQERDEEVVTLDRAWLFEASALRDTDRTQPIHQDNIILLDFERRSHRSLPTYTTPAVDTRKPLKRFVSRRWYDIGVVLFLLGCFATVIHCLLSFAPF